jgi:hypothetical protein
MLLIDRDFKRGGERFAIPSQGEVEGKLAVMEIVSIACLREVIRSKDEMAIAKLRRKVLRTLREECSSMKLTSEDEIAAADYALEVFNAALSEARRH